MAACSSSSSPASPGHPEWEAARNAGVDGQDRRQRTRAGRDHARSRFATNHYIYVYYTVPGTPAHNRVSRFTLTAMSSSRAASCRCWTCRLSDSHHNGGSLQFGPTANSTSASAKTSRENSSHSNPLGKILRINPDGTIPTDNPFYNQATGNNRAIWAMGLRNPFSTAVQPGTGLF